MTYEQAVDFIHSRLKFGSKLGLECTAELLARLDNPHQKLKFVHVAGTNGKGSTTMYLTNILIAQGYRTGSYLSPFVNRFAERIQINNQPIDEAALARCTTQVASVLDDHLQPTEFEIVTAVGMLYFVEQQCDYVVLEVGLGGRFDATNVIPPPALSVITSISIDHTQQLGERVEQIAFEKAGILKTGSPVVLYADNLPAVNQVLRQVAAQRGVPVTMGDMGQLEVLSQTLEGTRFRYKQQDYFITLLGSHQVRNAVTAIEGAQVLGISNDCIVQGLRTTIFPGRLQVVAKRPMVLIDGAHNLSGVQALKSALEQYCSGKKITLVMGMLADKEYAQCVACIAPVVSVFVATEPDNPRKLEAKELAAIAAQHCPVVKTIPNRTEAMAYAKANSGEDDVICLCGSLYLIGGMQDV